MDARTLCLGALEMGDQSGYEIKKLFEDGDLSFFYAVGFGSIYPALTGLVADGWATVTEQPQDKRPDKKVYAITERGRAALIDALMEPPGPDRIRSDLCFILLFTHLLPPTLVSRIIDGRIEWYRQQIAEMEREARERPVDAADAGAEAGAAFVCGLGLAIYRTAAEFFAANRERLLRVAGSGRGPSANAAE